MDGLIISGSFPPSGKGDVAITHIQPASGYLCDDYDERTRLMQAGLPYGHGDVERTADADVIVIHAPTDACATAAGEHRTQADGER